MSLINLGARRNVVVLNHRVQPTPTYCTLAKQHINKQANTLEGRAVGWLADRAAVCQRAGPAEEWSGTEVDSGTCGPVEARSPERPGMPRNIDAVHTGGGACTHTQTHKLWSTRCLETFPIQERHTHTLLEAKTVTETRLGSPSENPPPQKNLTWTEHQLYSYEKLLHIHFPFELEIR